MEKLGKMVHWVITYNPYPLFTKIQIQTHTHTPTHYWFIFLIPRDGFGRPSGTDGWAWRAFGISLRPAGCLATILLHLILLGGEWGDGHQTDSPGLTSIWPPDPNIHLSTHMPLQKLTYCTRLQLIPLNCSYQSVCHQLWERDDEVGYICRLNQ